ncbi:histone H1.1 [Genypterus blacodes]|uniref:histone H1.1 n=1 Tax=Genypterus blacodes TaxID=154954 RepID=UPI003F76D651
MSTVVLTTPSPVAHQVTPAQRRMLPPVSQLILKAVSGSKQRSGVSLVAVKKALQARGYDVARNNTRVLAAIKRLVVKEELVQTKGTGAAGSFKLNKKPQTPRTRKVRVERKKKPMAKKVKKTRAKPAAARGAASRAKTPRKRMVTKAKRPKKAKKPAAARRPIRRPTKRPTKRPNKRPSKRPSTSASKSKRRVSKPLRAICRK